MFSMVEGRHPSAVGGGGGEAGVGYGSSPVIKHMTVEERRSNLEYNTGLYYYTPCTCMFVS